MRQFDKGNDDTRGAQPTNRTGDSHAASSTRLADTAWARYEPSTRLPWDVSRVVHLHRRAGFAATWAEVERDLNDGPDSSIGRVLKGTSRTGTSEEFESTASVLADAAVASADIKRLEAWWIFRMLSSPDPLGERLTLMWHDHFATAQSKVDDIGLMRRQNDTFRRFARAPFGDLLKASVREPALLLYLDAPSNRKDHPNENLARELMELFTLGVGNYTETDVKEAARSLTGWTADDGVFRDAANRHDDGEKTLLGRTGCWKTTDLLSILLDQPSTAHRIAQRLCGAFMGEGVVDEKATLALADDLITYRLDIGHGVETILRSQAFFAARNIRTRVVGPAEFAIGACRALVPVPSMPSTLLVAEWTTRMGQQLFEPPNVGGWPGGRAWLSPRSLVARANFAAALVEGRPLGLPAPIDAAAIAAEQGLEHAARAVRGAARTLLLGIERSENSAARTQESPEAARKALTTVLASPEAQIG
jgi:uncharacterized protein (DUF1800 family)